MSIGVTDELAPLGAFPVIDDGYVKGSYRAVADVTARNAIATNSRKSGMLVRTIATSEMWVLGAGLTNGDWTLYAPSASLTVKDETTTLSSAVTSIDFQGAGVTATGTSAVTVTIPGATLTVKDETTTLSSAVTSIDFQGAGVTATGASAVVVTIPSGNTGVKTYCPIGINENTSARLTEVAIGSVFFDPTDFGTPTVVLRIAGTYTSTDAAGSAKVYIYDMGPGTGAFSPIRRAVATIPYANVGQNIKVDQALTLSATPGVDVDQIHTTARIYEARMYLNTTDTGSSMAMAWAGFKVTVG